MRIITIFNHSFPPQMTENVLSILPDYHLSLSSDSEISLLFFLLAGSISNMFTVGLIGNGYLEAESHK